MMREIRIPPILLNQNRSDANQSPCNMAWNLPRCVMRMPLPFCSITESLSSSGAPGQRQTATPKFVGTGGKEGPQERVLISEVSTESGSVTLGFLMAPALSVT